MDLKQTIKSNRWIIIIFIISLIIRLIFVFSSPLKIWDEYVYADLGYDLSNNPFDYSYLNKPWSDFVPGDWPHAAFKPPFLPFLLSLFYLLKLNLIVDFIMPIIGSLSVVLIYILGKKLFNKNTGLIASVFLALVPLHVFYSSKILNECSVTFLITLSFIFFWKGYEEDTPKYKMLFGVALALSLLNRYNSLWIFPIFFIYLLVRDRSLKFLIDRYLWYSIGIFFLILSPLLVFGIIDYGNPVGPFLHGFKSVSYWGGDQPWYFYLQNWNEMFSIVGFVILISLIFIILRKKLFDRQILILLIWILFFLIVASFLGHKEDRYLVPIAPAVCLLAAYFIDHIKYYKKVILIILSAFLIVIISNNFVNNYNTNYSESALCFKEGVQFIGNLSGRVLIYNDQSPLVYYYTHKSTRFYPSSWNINNLAKINKLPEEDIIFLFTDNNWDFSNYKNIEIIKEVGSKSNVIFECKNKTFVYQGSFIK